MKDIETSDNSIVLDGVESVNTSDMPTELITIAQLPIINEQLDRVKEIVGQRTTAALELDCTDENRKEIKAIRAALNKEHAELERRYKATMDEVLAPANAVQAKFKECTMGYKTADAALKAKISVVEDALKKEKSSAVQMYFNELAQAKGLDFISFEQMGLKIGLANSEKSLKKEVDTFLGRIACDLQMINSHDDADEILLEYKQNGFIVSEAVNTVTDRKKRIEDERKRRLAAKSEEEKKRRMEQDVLKAAEESQKDYEESTSEVETLQPPKPQNSDDDKVIVVNLSLGRYRAPVSKVKKLKKVIFDFIEKEGGFEKL